MQRLVFVVAVAACGSGASPAAPPVNNHVGIVVLDSIPADALVLEVRAVRWRCKITHAKGVETDELRVPVGRPIKLVVWTPEDVDGIEVGFAGTGVRERVTKDKRVELGFRVDHAGEYKWRCPTLVSPDRESPNKPLFAMSPAEYEAMLVANIPDTPVELGKKLYVKKGCASCHTVDGSTRIGPSWAGIWGTTVTLADGSTAVVDAAYVKRSMLEPSAFGRPGFPIGTMPSFLGQLRDKEIEALVAYIESLRR